MTHNARAARSALSLTTEFTLPHASYADMAFFVMPRYRFRNFLTSLIASASCLFDRTKRPVSTSASSERPLSEDSNKTSSVWAASPVGARKG
jgi:hypothetical protein